MLFRSKKPTFSKIPFHPEKQVAVLKCSICNGEQLAGFKDKETGKFQEVMFIRNEEDLQLFQEMYNLEDIKKEY